MVLPRLHENSSKQHEMPAHHALEDCLDAYLKGSCIACIADERKRLLFRAAPRTKGEMTRDPMHTAIT